MVSDVGLCSVSIGAEPVVRGHFVGHYLSALALAYAGGGERRVLERGRELLGGLRECQRAAGSGFLSAWPAKVLDTLEAGDFGKVWAPWYTLHKILAGLLNWHEHAEPESDATPPPPRCRVRRAGRTAGCFFNFCCMDLCTLREILARISGV